MAYAPTIVSISPDQGNQTGSTHVHIYGDGFSATPAVLFGGTTATSIVRVSATEITCDTPAKGYGRQLVVVKNTDGQTATASFFYFGTPVIDSVDPATGPAAGGTAVEILGHNFESGCKVLVGKNVDYVEAVATLVDSETLSVVMPAGRYFSSNVIVENPTTEYDREEDVYEYVFDAPTVTAVTPDTCLEAGGQAITIRGSGFRDGLSVEIDEEPCTSIVVVDAQTITCVTPALSAGTYDLIVANDDTRDATIAYNYTDNATVALDARVRAIEATL